MTIKRSPGCTCCDEEPCGCLLECFPLCDGFSWPWFDPNSIPSAAEQLNFDYDSAICYRPPPELTGESCQDLIINALVVTVGSMSNGSCSTCSGYEDSFCVRYVETEIDETITSPPTGPDECSYFITKVTWESTETAPCGPTVSEPLPAVTVEYTDPSGTGGTWTVYLNTTDTKGGVAVYSIDASAWACGQENTLDRDSEGAHCSTPLTVDIKPCVSCLRCEESGERKLIYEWQLSVSGIVDQSGGTCSPDCTALNGTFVLGVGMAWGSPSTGPRVDQCTWSLSEGIVCLGSGGVIAYKTFWTLDVDHSTDPPTITVRLMSRNQAGLLNYFTELASWSGAMNNCTGPFSLTGTNGSGKCDFSGASVSVTPLYS